jgi:hypothetical protein
MNLKNIMLSERSQVQKTVYILYHHTDRKYLQRENLNRQKADGQFPGIWGVGVGVDCK